MPTLRSASRHSPKANRRDSYCAREESRTPTGFTPQASETCASTNFATRAEVEPLRATLQQALYCGLKGNETIND